MYVYWLHLENHKDILTEGYIGVTNNPKRRFYEHKNATENDILRKVFVKYSDKIKMTLVFEGTEEDCYKKEEELRLKEIGWNLIPGGNKPPSRKGKHQLSTRGNNHPCKKQEIKSKISSIIKEKWKDPVYRQKQSESRKGDKNPRFGKPAWNKGKKLK